MSIGPISPNPIIEVVRESSRIGGGVRDITEDDRVVRRGNQVNILYEVEGSAVIRIYHDGWVCSPETERRLRSDLEALVANHPKAPDNFDDAARQELAISARSIFDGYCRRGEIVSE